MKLGMTNDTGAPRLNFVILSAAKRLSEICHKFNTLPLPNHLAGKQRSLAMKLGMTNDTGIPRNETREAMFDGDTAPRFVTLSAAKRLPEMRHKFNTLPLPNHLAGKQRSLAIKPGMTR